MIIGENTKSVPISKEQVWASYLEVRKHGKSAGVDGLTLKAYDQVKSKELYKVWNRMASGSYFPPAVKRAEIPKEKGKTRELGIPTVSDRVAQGVVKKYLEPLLEPHFHNNSFGYRPKRNAQQAIQQATVQCYKKAWVLDLDIESFFDHLNHEMVMQALQKHTTEKWVLMYVERWLKAPIEEKDGRLEYPTKGSPQGGVISPLISNLYLHYTFDRWMSTYHSNIEFERYADDIVVHCSSKNEAEHLLKAIKERFEECGLRLHPQKTRIVYCKMTGRKDDYESVSFDFLGLTFKPGKAQNQKTGKIFTSFGPAGISKKSTRKIIKTIRSKKLHRRTRAEISDLAIELKDHLQGWINSYFGRLNLQYVRPMMLYLNDRLVTWAVRRYKRFKRSRWKARLWLREVSEDYPNMFVHWKYGFKP